MKLWYKRPADVWTECLPLGNGSFGIMTDGGTFREKLYLNTDTFWSGRPKRENDVLAGSKLGKIRSYILKGHRVMAETLMRQSSLGLGSESYMPLPALYIDCGAEGMLGDYRRELDLETALHTARYSLDGNAVEKRCFCSYPDGVGVYSLRSIRKLSFIISFNSQMPCDTRVEDGVLYVCGNAPDSALPEQSAAAYTYTGKGMAFACAVKILTDGVLLDEGGAFSLTDATDTLIIISAETGFKGWNIKPETNPDAVKRSVLASLNRPFDYNYLFERHTADYSPLFKRVSLKLGKSGCGINGRGQPDECAADPSADELLDRARREGCLSPRLVEAYYDYGRYLLISSSREGSEPANLQGIWNKELRPSWGSNYTMNINLEMNYWLAGRCNLPECARPLLDFVSQLRESGKDTASANLKCNGFASFHSGDIWRKTTPVSGDLAYAYFPMAGVWLANELCSLYSYFGADRFGGEFKTLFGIVEDGARFVNDWLIPHKGGYVTCPSTSPELRYRSNFLQYSLDYSSAIDVSLIRELISNYSALCERAGVSPALLGELLAKREKLLPLKTGKYGIAEWQGDYKPIEIGHRHFSPLYGLYPGAGIGYHRPSDKALLGGAADFMKNRVENGGASTGWSAAWAVSLFARLHDSGGASSALKKLLFEFTFPNLLDRHPPNVYQIDGNLGGVAGINEMLVQEEDGILELLPAVPDVFSEGYISGFALKGGMLLDMQWKDKKVISLDIRPADRSKAPEAPVRVRGDRLSENIGGKNIILV